MINKGLKKWLTQLHEWQQRQWFIVSFFISASSIWFSLILNFWGEQLHLKEITMEGKTKFTSLGFVLTILVVFISFIIVIADKYYEASKLNNGSALRKLYLLEQVDIETNKICDNKFVTLKRYIWNIKNGKIDDIPQIVSKPCEQLKHILEKMNNCLCKLLEQKEYRIQPNELYISLYYNFPLENDIWEQADSIYPEKGLTIEELMSDKSTFSKVLKSKEPFIFYNSKEQARRLESYIMDEEDRVEENGALKGSIACYKIIVKENGQELIKAVLSFTTYSKTFVNNNKAKIINNVKYNMDEHILKIFSKRISIELCLLYLTKLFNDNAGKEE